MFTFIEFIEVVGLLNGDFECCCEGPCSDLFPGIMKDEEKRKCCKGSAWSTLDISGLGDIQINQSNLSLYIDLDCITQHPLLDKLLDRDVLEVMLSVIVDITRGNSETTPK